MFELTDEERKVKAWALTQDYPSVSARYAKTLAIAIKRAQEEAQEAKKLIAEMSRSMEKHEFTPGGISHGVSFGRKCPTCGRESFRDSPEDERHTEDCRYAYLLRQAKEASR